MTHEDGTPRPVERALDALGRTDRSRTANVFAAASALEGTGYTLQTALERYASRRNRHAFAPPPSLQRDLRRLCTAAGEQGHAVDAESAVEAAVPTERTTVLRRGRAIRSSRAFGPRERDRRLRRYLDAAREAGFDVDRATLAEYEPPTNSTAAARETDPPPEDPDVLEALLRDAGRNILTATER